MDGADAYVRRRYPPPKSSSSGGGLTFATLKLSTFLYIFKHFYVVGYGMLNV